MPKLGKKKKAAANARPLNDEERAWMRAFAMAALTSSFMSGAFGGRPPPPPKKKKAQKKGKRP